MATLTKTERVTADGEVRTASATIAWFLRSRPTGRTLTGAATRPGRIGRQRGVGRDEDLGVARAGRELGGELQGVAEVAACPGSTVTPSIAWRTRPRSVDSLTTMRALRPAAMTLTLPPVGRSRSASIAAGLAAVRRSGTTSVARHAGRGVDDEDDVPREAGRPLDERPGREQREDDDEQQLEQQQEAAPELLPRGVGLDVRDEPRPQQRRRDDRLVAAELEQVHRDDGRHEQQAEQRERRGERHDRV